MPKVFISHSSKDRSLVEQELLPLFRDDDIEPWYSRDDIKTAEEWEDAIKVALDSCDWFLVVVSPNSVASRWVKTETRWAVANREGRTIPVLLRDSDMRALSLKLPEINYVDYRGDRGSAKCPSRNKYCKSGPPDLPGVASVIPANAGIQAVRCLLDPGFRRGDDAALIDGVIM